ncbi:MAG: hypothetical protein AAB368_10575, partial [bacterium]
MTQMRWTTFGTAMLAVALGAGRVVAADATSGVILEGSQEARGMALADAITASNDAGAVQVNPAAAGFLEAPVASMFLKPEIAGQLAGSVGYAHPTSFGTFAGSVTYKTAGDLTYYTYDAAAQTFGKKTVN